MSKQSLWRCPECGEEFTTRNQWHSCGTFQLEEHFRNSQPHVRELYDRFVQIVGSCGGVKIIPQKSRIAFQVRMRFAALMPQRSALKGHLVLSDRHEDPCFQRIDTYSPRNHVHVFRLESLDQISEVFERRIREAYQVGEQQHLHRSGRPRNAL